MRSLFFDLDGTLIDSRRRLFTLFDELAPKDHGLSFERYWEIKRRQIDHASMLAPDVFPSFNRAWLERIEQPDYLALDAPFPGVTELLGELRSSFRLFVVTARQSKARAVAQVESFGWTPLLSEVLVTEGPEKEKTFLVKPHATKGDLVIGDTGKDVELGKALGLTTYAVLSGFRDRAALEKYHPDFIVERVTDIPFSTLKR